MKKMNIHYTYFCVDGELRKMSPKNYKELCERFPMKGNEFAFDSGSDWHDSKKHTDCLDWIVENSEYVCDNVIILNY